MSRDNDIQPKFEIHYDGCILTIVCDLSSNPISLPWGGKLSRYELVVGQEGILMGRLELHEKIRAVVAALSVSPESQVTPE